MRKTRKNSKKQAFFHKKTPEPLTREFTAENREKQEKITKKHKKQQTQAGHTNKNGKSAWELHRIEFCLQKSVSEQKHKREKETIKM